ncbi:T9SS type A sorting domain-containing protein [Bacteroidota bacterium]
MAIINYHGGDEYENQASGSRIGYYGITGYPTAKFDGVLTKSGGSAPSMYNQYVPLVNNRIGTNSSFTMDVNGSSSGLIDFNIDVSLEKTDAYSGANLRLHVVVTESHIPDNWGAGLTEVNNVERLMYPNHLGTVVDFSTGNTQDFNFQFSLDPSWDPTNCELVVFIQDNTSKESLQATTRDMMDFGSIYADDVSLTSAWNLPTNACLGEFTPEIQIRNNGNDDLTSCDIMYQVNGGPLSSYSWTGNLAFLETSDIQLDMISFTPEDVNELKIYSVNPNGNPDEYPINDTIIQSFEKFSTPVDVSLFFRTDENPEESTWELLNSNGDVIGEGGPYTQTGETVMESWTLDANDCYTFNFYDAGGDGLVNPSFFAFYYGNNNMIVQGIGDFGSKIGNEFYATDGTGINEIAGEATVNIYPNPMSNNATILINVPQAEIMTANVYNLVGEMVMTINETLLQSGENMIDLNASSLSNGLYFINIQTGTQQITKKITISK